MFYFTPPCRFCREQFPYWREMLARVDSNSFEVLGVVDRSEDKIRLEEYLKTMGCSAESPAPLRVALVPKEVLSSYKLSATPTTLLVDNDGTVEKVWAGRWTDTEAAAAEAALGVEFNTH